jgi:predicted nuclease of restriction endonuclease-like (RecB) superfamily
MAKKRKTRVIGRQSERLLPRATRLSAPASADRLLADVRALIEAARQHVAQAVNAGLVTLYWHVGRRIRQEVLGEERAAYGEQIVNALSTQLTAEYGRGFTRTNLFYMMQFAEVFPDEQIVHALRGQLSWTHFRELIAIDDPLKREFYAEMCRAERWSTRTLQDQIKRLVYERTAVSKKPEAVIRVELAALRDEDRLTPDLVFRDPYFLDFLGLPQRYQERDLEQAILRELEAFLLELGTDFTFVARQKRITVDYEDFYLDLLFYHRRLRRLVAIDLKIGRFQPADKGQMELYLRWLEKHETHADEEPPIGLILCGGKSEERVELLQLEAAGIRVAEYLTELPPREMLERKLHDAILLAREQLARQAGLAEAPPQLEPPSETPRKRNSQRG